MIDENMIDEGWADRLGQGNKVPYRRLRVTDGRWFAVVVIMPDTYATAHNRVYAELFDQHKLQYDVVGGRDRLRPAKNMVIHTLDETKIEQVIREKLRVLNMRRPIAKVRD